MTWMRVEKILPIQSITQGYYRQAEQARQCQVVDLNKYRESKQTAQNQESVEFEAFNRIDESLKRIVWAIIMGTAFVIVAQVIRWMIR